MSGLDKLYLQVPYTRQRTHILSHSLQDVLRRATLCRLIYRVRYLPEDGGNSKQVIGFRDYDGVFLKYDGYYDASRGYRNSLRQVILNPSRIGSASRLREFLGMIDTGWLSSSTVTRLDFAADYSIPIEEMAESIDVLRVQDTQLYIEDTSGQMESIYAGNHPDVTLVYDRHALYRRMGWVIQAPEIPCTRIERQIRTTGQIRRVMGRDVTYANLEDILNSIRAGHTPILAGRVQLARLIPEPLETLSDAQRMRLCELQAIARSSTYGRARRLLNRRSGDNFQRQYAPLFQQEDFPEQDQPDRILRLALTRYNGIRPRPRRPPAQAGALDQRAPLRGIF